MGRGAQASFSDSVSATELAQPHSRERRELGNSAEDGPEYCREDSETGFLALPTLPCPVPLSTSKSRSRACSHEWNVPPPWRQSRPHRACGQTHVLAAAYLEGGEVQEPSLDVAGVPPGHQTALLQGPQLGGGARPRRDHVVEAEPQRGRVFVRPLVLRWKGG